MEFRSEIILFLINWAVYEVDSLGTELDETLDIMEEVGQPKKYNIPLNFKKELVHIVEEGRAGTHILE